MRRLSTLWLLTLIIGTQARAAVAPQDGSNEPIWVSTFGDIKENEFGAFDFSSTMREIELRHANHTENANVARIWQYNGVLQLIGEGYFIVSSEVAASLDSECLYSLADQSFCIIATKKIRTDVNGKTVTNYSAIAKTQAKIKELGLKDQEKIYQLQEEVYALQSAIQLKTPPSQIPPSQYGYLGTIKGYLEGLDPYSNVLSLETITERSKNHLSMTKVGNIIHISFKYFDPSDSASSVYPSVARYLKANLRKDDRIIVDLRDNHGGQLSTALEMVQLFLSESYSEREGLVTTVEKMDGETSEYEVNHFNAGRMPVKVFDKNPLAVLINENSASASEIFASTLQHEGRAIVIGNRSYGKGTTLKQFPLIEGKLSFRILKGFYFTLGGQSPQKTGVTPDLMYPIAAGKNVFQESDEATSLPLPDLKSFNIKQSERIDLAGDMDCARQISAERGDGALRDDNEAIAIATVVLNRCFDGSTTSKFSMAR